MRTFLNSDKDNEGELALRDAFEKLVEYVPAQSAVDLELIRRFSELIQFLGTRVLCFHTVRYSLTPSSAVKIRF